MSGWKGEKVTLVPIDKQKHLENTLTWLNTPSVIRWWGAILPQTRAKLEEWFEEEEKSKESATLAILNEDNEHIGFVTLEKINWKQGSGHGSIYIGDPENWKKGYAYDALQVGLDYAFNHLGLRRIETTVFVDNEGSWKLIEKAGFQKEGRKKQAFFADGKYRDVFVYAILRDECLS